MTAVVVIPIVAAVVLKGVTSKLWAMIGTLQLINLLSILSVKIPTNVIKVQEQSQYIINFSPK